MMLAYQPVRSLSSLNIVLNQGLSAAAIEFYQSLIQKTKLLIKKMQPKLKLYNGSINFTKCEF